MKTKAKTKRLIYVWGTDKRGFISIRPHKQPHNAISTAHYSNRECAARMARYMRTRQADQYDYKVIYQKPKP